MKLNEKDVDIESTETLESIDFSIDMNSLGVLMKGFSDNLYSNKIGSIVREIASNCFDAHAEVGNSDPVEIELIDREGEYQITFRDFGPGLSPERIRMVYSKYFSSTKRDSNNEIGGFGIGAKSPFSYTDSFIVKTWVDNVEYHYIMHRGVTVPEIKLIYKNEVEHKNSTEIVIPIKNFSDLQKFKAELRSQLKYFDNIDYLGGCGIDNDYNILQIGPTIVREGMRIDSAGSLEVCIGKVRYPLDTNQIPYPHSSEMREVASSLALKFEIGEISVTMTRESIEYTDTTVAAIVARFKEAQVFFSHKYAEYLDKGAVTLSSYIAAYRDANPRLEFPTPTGMCSLSMKGFLNDKTKVGKFKALEQFDFIRYSDDLLWAVVDIKSYYEGKPISLSNYSRRAAFNKSSRISSLPRDFRNMDAVKMFSIIHAGVNGLPPLYRKKAESGPVTALKLAYIAEQEDDSLLSTIVLKSREDGEKFFYKECIASGHTPSQAEQIAAYAALRKVVIDEVKTLPDTKSYEATEVSQAFIDTWKATKTRNLVKYDPNEEVIVRRAFLHYNRLTYEIRWSKNIYRTEQLVNASKKGVTIIYGTQAQVDLLAAVSTVVSFSQSYRTDISSLRKGQRVVVKLAATAIKTLVKITDNMISVDEFVKTPAYKKAALRLVVASRALAIKIQANYVAKCYVDPEIYSSCYNLEAKNILYSSTKATYLNSEILKIITSHLSGCNNWGVSVENRRTGNSVSLNEVDFCIEKWNKLNPHKFLGKDGDEASRYSNYRYLISMGHLPNMKDYLKLRSQFKLKSWKMLLSPSVSGQDEQSA